MHELTIHLKTHSGTPLYEQIYSYIKENIREGKIVCGEKLPSTRSLCCYLEVSRSTVELAYGQLLSEGYIESVPCRGFFVAQVDDLLHLEAAPARSKERKEEKKGKPAFRYDFSPSGVDLRSFPYNAWRRLSGRCSRTTKRSSSGWGIRRGSTRSAAPSAAISTRPEA